MVRKSRGYKNSRQNKSDKVELLNKIYHLLYMKKELDEILYKVRALLPYSTQKYQVNSIEIFGAYLRNEQVSGSDLDLLISFSKVPSLIKFVELKNYLTDQLQINVDLVMKDALKPRLSQNILNEAIPI